MTPESKTHNCRRFVSHNSASISPWRVEDKEVNQEKKSHRCTGNQMAHMVMLRVSCQQDMKLYASWTRCSSKEVHLVPLLPYPVATAGNSPQHNSAGPYLDVVGELEVGSCVRADSENKVSISCKPPVWTVRSQRRAVDWRWKIPVWRKKQFVRIYRA